MPHVITQNCCNDAGCVEACPVDCIHPRPDEPGFATAEMLFIDPKACIDCGACVPMCPVEAIEPADFLAPAKKRYEKINAFYAAQHPEPAARPTVSKVSVGGPPVTGAVRVAVVGAGPAGLFAAEHLLAELGIDVEVDVYDRLPTPYGLIRAGVAPDHVATKGASNPFRWTETRTGFRYRLGVEVGADLSHDELRSHYHAVIYATGATNDRSLGIPGEDLPGSHGATEFVAWYNGHPDHADRTYDFSTDRAVVIGNGNVALDVARILLADVDALAATDIADHALEALRSSAIREVVVLGRRGPAEAAYTSPELLGLSEVEGVDLVVDPVDLGDDHDAPLKLHLARELAERQAGGNSRQIRLRYLRSPVEILGSDRVSGVRVVRNELRPGPDGRAVAYPTDDHEVVEAGLVLRAVGHHGNALDGVSFDAARGVITNEDGRVVDADGTTLPGVYTTGWVKRGASGVIGTNKKCAADTVARLLDDARAGRLPEPDSDRRAIDALIDRRRPDWVDLQGWQRIDRHERTAGQEQGRVRAKVTDVDEQRRHART
ncbi:MAG: FAD-dependent oxidoreductase [Mycobacterium kyogaense]|uniref:FAD-dependent oxidoreductase n=1 Tax=Mycobacterium kyogaense TaxID=2212479 RepID=UPI002FF9721F